MKKRVVSLVIALILLLQSMFANAVIVTDTADNNSAQKAYEILQYIGLMDIDVSYELIKNDAVTRGSFALYLSKLFNLSPDSDEIEKAIESVMISKIMVGDGNGNFNENEHITVQEMTVAAVRALGYTSYDTGWEFKNYITKAQALDILDGISTMGRASMSDCIVFIYNVLHTNSVMIYHGVGEWKENVSVTPLESTYGLKCVKGNLTANAYVGLVGEKTNTRELVRIDGMAYPTKSEELGDWIGYNVIAYYKADDTSKTIEFFVTDVDNKTITISSEDFDSFDSGSVKYVVDNKTKSIRLTSDVVIIKNSKVVTTDYASAFNMDFGTITCISTDDKYSVVIIDAYENYAVNSIDISRKILYTDKVDESGKTITIDIGKSDYTKIVMLPYEKEVNENTIQPDDLLSIAMSDDKSVIKGFLCSEKVSGTLNEVSLDNGSASCIINETEYKLDEEFYNDKKLSVGDKGSFTIDAFGRVAAYFKDTSKVETIAYLYELYNDDSNNRLTANVFTVDRKHFNLKLADKINYNGDKLDSEKVQAKLCTKAGSELRRQLISYKLNADGEISSITTAAENKEARIKDNTLYTLLPKGSYYWYYQMKSFNRQHILSKNTYYMRVPPEDSDNVDKKLFGCQTFSNVTWYNSNGNKNILGLYKFSDETPFADILLVSNTDGASLVTTTELTMVSSLNKVVGPDGESAIAIHGYRRGNEITAYITEDEYKNDIEAGDLIRFANNIYGYVGKYEIVYDQSEDKVMWQMGATADEYSSHTTSPAASLRYTFGYVNDLYIAPNSNGYNSVIQIGKTAGETNDIYQMDASTSATTRYIIFDKDRREDKVYMGHLDEIVPYSSSKNAADTSRVFIHTRSGWLIAVFIYK